MRRIFIIAGFLLITFYTVGQNLHEQVQIRRTDYGVPHILGENLKAASFGLAYAQLEDRGAKVIEPLLRAQGIYAKYAGEEYIEQDLYAKLVHELTESNYNQLKSETKQILEGFAAGVNYYLSRHQNEFPQWYYQEFTAVDVATVSNFGGIPQASSARDFLKNLEQKKKEALANADVGSNAWAFSPERTKSGKAILMRNPHLSWEAGYYEAQITVPGVINFYGDFRIGGMFLIICGFNDHLGWSTTNNHPDLEEVYALELDTTRADHYWLDGESLPIERQLVEVEFKNGSGSSITTKEWLFTEYGPVIERSGGKIYIVKTADWMNFRRGDQLTTMMLSKNLDEFRQAMQMRAISSSNYTYADSDGNIYYIWNASTPLLTHEYLGDTVAHEVSASSQIWSQYQKFDMIPQLTNPQGGYLQNSNDPFHLTNLNEPIFLDGQPSNYPEPRLRLRSQHSLQLIDNNKKFSLEDVVTMKHSMNALAGDRMKSELIAAMRASTDNEIRTAADHLEKWDNTFAASSRGSVLFYEWFWNYDGLVNRDSLYSVRWNLDNPTSTPYGVHYPDSAVKAMRMSIDSLNSWYGTYDLTHGEVYRVRRGPVDVPVGGGSGTLGNFRVLWFEMDEDKKRKVVGGDGWVFAVEFGKKIKAYSILAYGQSNNPESAHFSDQAQMFADNKMKKVAFYEKDIRKNTIKVYKPGKE